MVSTRFSKLTFQKRLALIGALSAIVISVFAFTIVNQQLKQRSELNDLRYIGQLSLTVGEAYCTLNNSRHTLYGYMKHIRAEEPRSDYANTRIEAHQNELDLLNESLRKLDALLGSDKRSDLSEQMQESINKLETKVAEIRRYQKDTSNLVYKKPPEALAVNDELQKELVGFITRAARLSSDVDFSKNLVALQGFLIAKREFWKLRGHVFSVVVNNRSKSVGTVSVARANGYSEVVNNILYMAEVNGTDASSRHLDAFLGHPDIKLFLDTSAEIAALGVREISLDEGKKAFERFSAKAAQVEQAYYRQPVVAVKAGYNICGGIEKFLEDKIASVSRNTWAVLIGSLVAMLSTFVAFAYVMKSTISKIEGSNARLSDSSERSALAAQHLRSASQQLATHASEEAATNEKVCTTLASLSELSKSNKEKLGEAKGTVVDAMEHAREGATAMEQMNTAMLAIQSSSNDISQIIGSIEEIAFQTNILALNAAIEAARAGEAGAGFSVVAEQVRELAHRSSSAAGETKERIANALQNSEQGMEMTERVTGQLDQIVEKIEHVKQSTEDISQAVAEQTEGIASMDESMEELNHATRQLAANSEENAAAAEELRTITNSIEDCSVELGEFLGKKVERSQKTFDPFDSFDGSNRQGQIPTSFEAELFN